MPCLAAALLGSLVVLLQCLSHSEQGNAFLPSQAQTLASSSRRAALVSGLVASAVSAAPQASEAALTAKEKATIALFQKTSPSVVSVSGSQGKKSTVMGTGFVWDKNHAVTTLNMVRGVDVPKITVLDRNPDGTERRRVLNAAIVGADPGTDVAVLWVDGDMTPLRRGSAEDLFVGQDVYSLGNPLGLEHSFSKGVVSGKSRTVSGSSGRPIGGVIQTDASINPGNNGGPLLDSSGLVVGVNAVAVSENGASSGVGLAIPIEAVERSVTSVLLEGQMRWPSLGVFLAADVVSAELGLDGVLVKKVAPGGPAEAAGIQPMRNGRFDVITSVDEKSVANVGEFFLALDGKRPGEEVLLTVQRAKFDSDSDNVDNLQFKVRLGSRVL